MAIIEARGLSKTYPAHGRGVLLGRGGLASWWRGAPPTRAALAPMELSIGAGESVGIIGRNGSGKSTLLKLIAGVTAPSSGTLAVDGRVASLLELGAGFHPMLTGRENVYLYAGLLGMNHTRTKACFDAIVDFAELREAIDRTVDTYSSGMYVRLAFAVAVHSDPDIFLVDEVLAVGDEAFQRKCRATILSLNDAGKTILFVSHDLGIVQSLCDRVLLLEGGEVVRRGDAQSTIEYYLRASGHGAGVHRLRRGAMEALFNNGRIALYRDGREVTAPAGIKVQFHSLGHYHESTGAEWTMVEATESTLEARGRMPRLPVTLHLKAALSEDRLAIDVSWENDHPLDLSYSALQCFFPVSFTGWQFGAASGDFPAITFKDRQWCNVVPASHEPGDCYLLDGDASSTGIQITCENNAVPLQLDNTDYLEQARLAHVAEAFPSAACPLPPGRRTLGRLEIGCGVDRGTIETARQASLAIRSVPFAGARARMDAGAIAILAHEVPLSAGLHLHVQLKVDGLWVLSHALQWDAACLDNHRVTASGRSTRLPVVLEWTIAQVEDELALDVSLAVDAPILLDEFNVSLNLCDAFTDWKTPEEEGRFEAGELSQAWRHLNTRFVAGDRIQASSATTPVIALRGSSALGTVHPTAIITGGGHSDPVLQLLCSPGQAGVFALQPGRHELFSGRVSVGRELDS